MSDPLDDEIDLLARAFREEVDGEVESDATLRAILGAPNARPAGQSWWLAAAVVIAALLGAPTAWAWWSGRLDVWVGGGSAVSGVERAEPVVAPPMEPSAAEGVLAPVEVSVSPAVPRDVPHVTERARVRGREPRARMGVREGESDGEGESEPIDPVERRAYEAAHALHFGARAPADALVAWDAYLADHPHGRFAVEARYNRALALLRLGRRADAREALTPFADGAHGEYRRRDASDLIQAIDAAP